MGNKRNSAKGILAAQRRQRVWELRQQHYTQQQIADQVGITPERVCQILKLCIEEQDRQVLAAKDQYRKFLMSEAETTERRLYATLALIPIIDVANRMKVEEQIRKNMELRAKLTAADRVPAVLINQTGATNVLSGVDVAKVLAEADAWAPPQEAPPPIVLTEAVSVGGG